MLQWFKLIGIAEVRAARCAWRAKLSDNTDILKFQLDIADVEAKARRMDELLRKIASGKAAGQDTSGLEKSLATEIDRLSRSKGKTDEAQLSLEKLLKSKRDLADVISLLGGRFGGLVGDKTGAVELFLHLGKAAAPLAVIVGTVTAWHQAQVRLNDALEKTLSLEGRISQAQRQRRTGRMEMAAQIQDTLQTFGAATIANIDAANRNAVRLTGEFGIEPVRAGKAAAVAATIGTGSLDDAAAIDSAIALGMEATPAAARKLLGNKADRAAALEIAQRLSKTQVSINRALSVEAGDLQSAAVNPVDVLFGRFENRATLPDGVTTADQFRDWLAKAAAPDIPATPDDPQGSPGLRPTNKKPSAARMQWIMKHRHGVLRRAWDYYFGGITDEELLKQQGSENFEKAALREFAEIQDRVSGNSPQYEGVAPEASPSPDRMLLRRFGGGGSAPSTDPLEATSSSGQPIIIHHHTNIGTQQNVGNVLRDVRYSPTGELGPGYGARKQDQTSP